MAQPTTRIETGVMMSQTSPSTESHRTHDPKNALAYTENLVSGSFSCREVQKSHIHTWSRILERRISDMYPLVAA